MKGLGTSIGTVVGGVAGSIIPGAGTMAGAAVGGAVGGLVDTYRAQNEAKMQRTQGMFGGPRVRPQPKMGAPIDLPQIGVPYLGAPQAGTPAPAQIPTSGMMMPAATQGG